MDGKNKLSALREKYKKNPGWYWLTATLFLFFVLPEYISPFILFIAFGVFKRQWKREGRLAKVGTVGKIEIVFMLYMLLSVLWSKTKLDTLGCAGLWWAVFLIQVMIYNLARTKQRIKKVITAVVASAAVNGVIASLQMISYSLYIYGKISKEELFVTPLYRNIDIFVYSRLPFDISTNMWMQRASGCFSNPNLLATFMIIAFPLAVYLLVNAKNGKSTVLSFFAVFAICAGMASTMSRAGCLIVLAEWLFLFIVQFKRHKKEMLFSLVLSAGTLIPSILTRYGVITFLSNGVNSPILPPVDGAEAVQSSRIHLKIWSSMIDYLIHHFGAFTFGTGFGMEQTGAILFTLYNLDKPHAHNFIIEIWTELGIIGIAFLALIIIITFGKLLEINSNSEKKITLVFAVSTSFVALFVFGLTDYIFNSPKQIILMMTLIGITQAMSYVYDKTIINSTNDFVHVAEQDLYNIIHQ